MNNIGTPCLTNHVNWGTLPHVDLRYWQSEKVRKVARIALTVLAVIAALTAIAASFATGPLAIIVLPSAIAAGLSAITSIALWCLKPHPNDPGQRLEKRRQMQGEVQQWLHAPTAESLTALTSKYPETIFSKDDWNKLFQPELSLGPEAFKAKYPDATRLLNVYSQRTLKLFTHAKIFLSENASLSDVARSAWCTEQELANAAIPLRIAELEKQCILTDRDQTLFSHASEEKKNSLVSAFATKARPQLVEKGHFQLTNNPYPQYSDALYQEVVKQIEKDFQNQGATNLSYFFNAFAFKLNGRHLFLKEEQSDLAMQYFEEYYTTNSLLYRPEFLLWQFKMKRLSPQQKLPKSQVPMKQWATEKICVEYDPANPEHTKALLFFLNEIKLIDTSLSAFKILAEKHLDKTKDSQDENAITISELIR